MKLIRNTLLVLLGLAVAALAVILLYVPGYVEQSRNRWPNIPPTRSRPRPRRCMTAC